MNVQPLLRAGGDPPCLSQKGFLFDPTAINQWSHTDINPPQSICSRNQQWRKRTGGEPRFPPNHAGGSMHGSQLWDAPGNNGVITDLDGSSGWELGLSGPSFSSFCQTKPCKEEGQCSGSYRGNQMFSLLFFLCVSVCVYFSVNP